MSECTKFKDRYIDVKNKNGILTLRTALTKNVFFSYTKSNKNYYCNIINIDDSSKSLEIYSYSPSNGVEGYNILHNGVLREVPLAELGSLIFNDFSISKKELDSVVNCLDEFLKAEFKIKRR